MGNVTAEVANQIEAIDERDPVAVEKACREYNLCLEDDQEDDELYIDEATKRNDGVSSHIMYVKALCHREVRNYADSLLSYAKVMKTELEFGDYERLVVNPINESAMQKKNIEGPGAPGWKVCLYSHFKRLNILRDNIKLMMVDLN